MNDERQNVRKFILSSGTEVYMQSSYHGWIGRKQTCQISNDGDLENTVSKVTGSIQW